jgi:hypothetical protein
MDGHDLVSVRDAYRAMFRFLDVYYELTKSDEVAGLLGGMNLRDDGTSMDPAMWHEWLKAVQKAISSEPDNQGSS